jgi:hypothetical protein
MAYSDAMRRLVGISTLLCCLLGAAGAPAAEDGYYVGAYSGIDVMASPSSDAASIGHLQRLRPVRIEERQRSWARITPVDAPRVSGWVPEGALRQRYDPPKEHRSTSSFFSGLAALFGGSDNETETAVLGVRGLENEGKLGNRVAPAAEVQWMESLHVSDQDISDFVRQGRLNP